MSMHVNRIKMIPVYQVEGSLAQSALGNQKGQTVKPFKTSNKRGISNEQSAGGDFISLESELRYSPSQLTRTVWIVKLC